jgi:hypothetical protein
MMIRQFAAFSVGAMCAAPLCAQIVVETLGAAAPPPLACGRPLTPFDPDPRPLFLDVPTVPCPASTGLDPIQFSPPMSHRVIGTGWGSWSHGYTGDVYYSNGGSSVTIGLPESVASFALYAEPGPFALIEFELVATDSSGDKAMVRASIEGRSGAAGFAFCATRLSELLSIAVRTIDGVTAFSIGEFGVTPKEAGCYADCDGSGALDFFDFLCFQGLVAAGDPGADCDGDGELTFFDFLCFQNAFAAGCD